MASLSGLVESSGFSSPFTKSVIGAATSISNVSSIASGLTGSLTSGLAGGLASGLASSTSGLSGALSSFGKASSASPSAATTDANNITWVDNTPSDKRLNIVRPRSAKALYNEAGKTGTYSSDRGVITSMRILKNKDYDLKAAMKDMKVDDEVTALLSESGFTSFFVTSFSTSFSEKSQVMTTFGDNEVVYYFGKQPITMTVNGLLFDSIEHDWFSKFITLYAGALRGTQLAKNFGLIQLNFPNMVVTGTISQLSTSQDSTRDTDIPFSFSFIVKDLIPKPIAITGTASNLVGTLVDFKANRSGVTKLTLGSGTSSGGFLDKISSLSNTATSVSNSLNAFRTNIFTPIYGIISSITKIVKTATGNISSIISSFTSPVNAILRDINNVASQAIGVANLIESSVNKLTSIPGKLIADVSKTLSNLKNAAGIISRVPENVADSFKRLTSGGFVKQGAPVLSSGKAKPKSKAAILGSGRPYSISTSNKL